MKTAWIENGQIRDIAPGDPASFYHPEIAKFYDTQVPDEAQNGDSFVDGVWTARPAPEPEAPSEPPAPVPPKVSPVEYMLLFTSPERVAIKALRPTDPIVDDFLDIIEDPRLTHVDLALPSTQGALDYLTAVGVIAAGRKAEILSGVVS